MFAPGATVTCKRGRRLVMRVVDVSRKDGLIECEVLTDDRGSISNRFFRSSDLMEIKRAS